MGIVKYSINGTDFATYGVYVSKSDGLIGAPALKSSYTQDWNDRHGVVPYTAARRYQTRKITLQCFVVGSSRTDMVTKLQTFARAWNQPHAAGYSRTERLTVDVTPDATSGKQVLPYEVALTASIELTKTWKQDGQSVGTFSLQLEEYEPCKRVYKVVTNGSSVTKTITINSATLFNIYWGDGKATFDAGGASAERTYQHTFSTAGTYYVVVCGDIDNSTITFGTEELLWSRLP